jgi:hypothetical protein
MYYNSSYTGGRGRRISVPGQSEAALGKNVKPNKIRLRGWKWKSICLQVQGPRFKPTQYYQKPI